MHKRRPWRAAVLLCLFLALASAFALEAGAVSAWPKEAISDRVHTHYERIPVSVSFSSGWVADCRLIDETTYAPLRSFADAILPSARVSYNDKTRTATVEAEGMYLTATDGANYIAANGRYLYTQAPVVILDDGRMYLPIRLLSQATGVTVTWNADARSVTLSGGYTPILSGDKFYREDEVYWLSRIISAESQGEPLLGQIAVGNVVLNRMRHADYPHTIYGVIFDRKWGVQFSPVANGTVYHEPYWRSIIAAKLCLEGVTVSKKVLFFYDPDLATSFWIPSARPYAFRIGGHYFFY